MQNQFSQVGGCFIVIPILVIIAILLVLTFIFKKKGKDGAYPKYLSSARKGKVHFKIPSQKGNKRGASRKMK